MRVCSVSGCGSIYPRDEGTRCSVHRRQARAARHAYNGVYSRKAHRSFRQAVLEAQPICVLCDLRESLIADHYPLDREELVSRGLDPNDPQHGRGLCRQCDSRQTASRQPGGWNNR